MIKNVKEANIKVLSVIIMLFAIIYFLVLSSNTSLVINEKKAEVNGNNSNQIEMNASDLVIPTRESILKDGYPINENGQTYGPNMGDLMLDEHGEPDLMLAEGENGVLGYIYQPVGISSPSELDEYNKSLKKSTPLYLHDGKTIIGIFNFS